LLGLIDKIVFPIFKSGIAGLSAVFEAAGVVTPQYAVAQDVNDVLRFAQKYGIPLFVKIDSSSAGFGVFECKSIDFIKRLPSSLFEKPVLVQEKINGTVIGVDAFYRDAQLIYYSYSERVLSSDNDFGPSSVRRFRQVGDLGDSLYDELQMMGKVLGANGFANITAIQSTENNVRYYFEADMRPTAWVFIGKYIGLDLSDCIKRYYEFGEVLRAPLSVNNKFPLSIVLPLFFRMDYIDILLNKYRVWKYIYCTASGNINIYLHDRIIRSVVVMLKKILPKYLCRKLKTAISIFANN